MGEKGNIVYAGFWRETPKRKKLLARRRHRWEDNIKIDFKAIEVLRGSNSSS
jgi:hypothetical protein